MSSTYSPGLARLSRSLGSMVIDKPRAASRQRAGTATAQDLHNATAYVPCTACGAHALMDCKTASGRRAAKPHAARLAAAGLA